MNQGKVGSLRISTVRIVLATAMGTVLAVMAGNIFDEFLWELLIGPLMAGSVALGTRGLRWPWQLLALGATVAAAVIVAVLIAGGSLADAWPGVLSGPQRVLTTEWPSPSDPILIASITLLLAASTAIAAWLAGGERHHLLPIVPPVVTFVMVIGLSAPVPPSPVATVAFGVLVVAFALARQGERAGNRARLLLGERTVALSGALIAMAALAGVATIAWADRADPRRTEDALESAILLEPIEQTVALREAEPPIELFHVTDRSALIGTSLPARWRMAALDVYDGQRWIPQVALRPIGGRLGLPSPPSPDVPPPISYDLEFLTDDLDLIPFPGRPLLVSEDVETDLDRVTVRLIERPKAGSVIDAVSEVAPVVTSSDVAFATRQVDEIAGGFTETASLIAGTGTVLEQLRQLESTMRTEWQLDPGAPGGGQQLALIDRFVNETRRGTEEQFVTAFALMVRSLGFDARVATGFVVPPDALTAPLVLSSPHAAVWPEVLVEGVGWTAFDPKPPTETSDEEEQPPPPQAQSPTAAQPPIAPPTDPGDDNDEIDTATTTSTDRWATVRTWLTRAGVAAGLGLLPIAIAIGSIVWLKWARRRRRRRATEPDVRIRGVWANTTDSLVDAGLTIRPSWTDAHIADAGAPIAPTVPHEIRRLASMSTAATFGATASSAAVVDDAERTASAVDEAILAGRTRWQRVRWHLSLRSLRRATRSPVVT